MFILNGILLDLYETNEKLDIYEAFKMIGLDLDSIKSTKDLKLYVIRCNKANSLYYGKQGNNNQLSTQHYEDIYYFFSEDEATKTKSNYVDNNPNIREKYKPLYQVHKVEQVANLNTAELYNQAFMIIQKIINAKKFYVIQLNAAMHKFMSNQFDISLYRRTGNLSVKQEVYTPNEIIYFKSLNAANKAATSYKNSGRLTSSEYEKSVVPIEVDVSEIPENLTSVTIEISYNNIVSTIPAFVETTKLNKWLTRHNLS